MPTEIPKTAPIYVAGHRGLVGSAILRRLAREGYTNLLTASRDQLDLRDQAAVNYWFKANRISRTERAAFSSEALASETLVSDFGNLSSVICHPPPRGEIFFRNRPFDF